MARIHPLLLAACLACLPGVSAGAELDVASEAQAARIWQLEPGGQALAWPAGTRSPVRACVHLGYSIGRDGGTSNFILLSAWGEGVAADVAGRRQLEPFVRSASATLQARHFRALERGRNRPLFTSTTFVFQGVPGGDAASVHAHCSIGDLRSFVSEELARGYRRGNLDRSRLEHIREQYPGMIPDGPTRHPGWID